jgi:hypothetical protein
MQVLILEHGGVRGGRFAMFVAWFHLSLANRTAKALWVVVVA